jgi:hypothetical protein
VKRFESEYNAQEKIIEKKKFNRFPEGWKI